MALNLSRIFKGRTPAKSVVTDNVDPDELGAASVDGKFGPETEAVIGLDVWEHAASVPGGTATPNVIGLGEPANTPGSQAVDAGSETARSMQPGVNGLVTGVEFPTAKWEGPDFDATKIEFPNLATSESVFDGSAGAVIMKDGANNVTLENFRSTGSGGTPDGVKWVGPDFDANTETPFDEADALFGRSSQNVTAQYNPKEIGIDKLNAPNEVAAWGASEIDLKEMLEARATSDAFHPNQGNNYTATDDLWKFRGDSQGGSGTDNANRSMAPGEGTLSRLDAGRPEGPGWYVPDMDSDQSGMSASSGQPAGWVNSVEFPNLKADGAPGETGFASSINDQTPADWNERSVQPGQPGQGFMMQDGELYPRGLRDFEYSSELMTETATIVGADSGASGADNANRTTQPGTEREGFMMQDGELYPRGLMFDGFEGEALTADQGQQGDGFMMQDGELYPRGLKIAAVDGEPPEFDGVDKSTPLIAKGVHAIGVEVNSVSGPTEALGPWETNARSAVPGAAPEAQGFMMQDGELYPRGLRDMEIELGKESGQGSSVQAGDDAGRPHESLSMNIRETALGGPDTTERFKVEIEGVAFKSGGPDGGENARSAGPGAAGFRPNPAGDGTTQQFSAGQDVRMDSQFQAMPDLDASGNSVVDAADYTLWRDNLRGSNPPEGILPYIEQSNLVGGARFNGSEDQLKTLMGNLQQKGLIDTSTGEILWATGGGSQTQASDSELDALVAWLRSTQPRGAGGVAEFRFEGLPGDTDYVANASKNELSIETIEIEEGGGSRHARVVDYREGGLNDTTHRFADDDGPSTFLDALGEGAKTTDATSLKVEWITALHASEHDQPDHDFGVDDLDTDVDVP